MAAIRQIVMFNWVTADGFFAAPDGVSGAGSSAGHGGRRAIPRFDTVLLGRRTFEIFEAFWKDAVDEARTAPDPHAPGQRSREHGAIGIWLHEATKFVFSKTLRKVEWKNSPHSPSIGSVRDRRDQEAAWQGYNAVWQRVYRLTAHAARLDR